MSPPSEYLINCTIDRNIVEIIQYHLVSNPTISLKWLTKLNRRNFSYWIVPYQLMCHKHYHNNVFALRSKMESTYLQDPYLVFYASS